VCFDPDYISGGSGSGSAVAVALGLASLSLVADTAGSGRVPACFNNLVGVMLRQIVLNLEPGSLAAHKDVALGFYSRVCIQRSEGETKDFGGCIKFRVKTGTAVPAKTLVFPRRGFIEPYQFLTFYSVPIRRLYLCPCAES